MDAQPPRHPQQDLDPSPDPHLGRRAPERYDVRISDGGEIAAALPHLLGFHPSESLVLVSLTGPTGRRVGLTVRADIPPAAHAAGAARLLARSVATDRPRAVVLAVVSEADDAVVVPGDSPHGAGEPSLDLPHRPLLHEVVVALAAAGIPVRDALLVRRGRWWSYDCPHACCVPAAGTLLPGGVSELAVASVATGQVVQPDRGALGARIAPPGGPAAAAMAAAGERVAADCAALQRDAGVPVVAEESWTAITAAVSRCRPGARSGARRMADEEIARVVWGLRDTAVRDRALGLALGDDAAAAELLWTECTRRTPSPGGAAPATLLAVGAWLRGDGAMASIALRRALDSEPLYALARLLTQALAACLSPAELRALITATVPTLDGSPTGG